METKKHAVENIPVEFHDIFAKHRMYFGMNTAFKVRPTPKDVKAVFQPKPTDADAHERRLNQ